MVTNQTTLITTITAFALLLVGSTLAGAASVNALKEIILYYKEDGTIGIGYHDDDCMCSHYIISPTMSQKVIKTAFLEPSFKTNTNTTETFDFKTNYSTLVIPQIPSGTIIKILSNETDTIINEAAKMLGNNSSNELKNVIEDKIISNNTSNKT